MFPIIDASSWPVVAIEPAGDDPKFWLADPDGREWLFKEVVVKNGHRQGEDWSEKLASECADLLCVPAAEIMLARREGREGCLSRNVRPRNWMDQTGSTVLGELVPGFDKRAKGRPGHSLMNIKTVLTGYGPPPQFDGPTTMDGFDVFAGYLILDAWIANQDRHSDNWSVLEAPDKSRRLMPSYDHASCLAFNLTDVERTRRLEDRTQLDTWLRRGRAGRFENGRNTSLVEHAINAFDLASVTARDHWMARLDAITSEDVAQLVASTPIMSDPARRLAEAILAHNRRRVLDACSSHPR